MAPSNTCHGRGSGWEAFLRSENRELSGHPKMTQKTLFPVTSGVNYFYKVSIYIFLANFFIIAKIATYCDIIDFFTFKIFENFLKIELKEIRP